MTEPDRSSVIEPRDNGEDDDLGPGPLFSAPPSPIKRIIGIVAAGAVSAVAAIGIRNLLGRRHKNRDD